MTRIACFTIDIRPMGGEHSQNWGPTNGCSPLLWECPPILALPYKRLENNN